LAVAGVGVAGPIDGDDGRPASRDAPAPVLAGAGPDGAARGSVRPGAAWTGRAPAADSDLAAAPDGTSGTPGDGAASAAPTDTASPAAVADSAWDCVSVRRRFT
jgi:hypothetical protein